MLNEIILEGERVKLVPLHEEHTEALYRAGSFPEIWSYWSYMPSMPSRVNKLEDMEKWVNSALTERDKGTRYPFVVIDKETDEAIGCTCFLQISLPNRSLEIGATWYTPRVWRSRVNTECKYLLLNYCFEELKLLRVSIKTDSRNLRSQKAIERLGAVKEGVLRNERILSDGYVRDAVYYSIIDRDWPEVKERLEGFLK